MLNLYSIPPLLTLCFFFCLGVLTMVLGSRSKVNNLFVLICLACSFLHADIFLISNVYSPDTALFISRFGQVFAVFLIPLYIHFFHSYLQIDTRKWLTISAYIYSIILICFVPTPLLIKYMHKHFFGFFGMGGRLYLMIGLSAAAASVYVLSQTYTAIRNEKNAVRKKKLKYLFVGFAVIGVMIGLDVLPILGYPVYPPGNFSFIPLGIFALGHFKYDLLDTDLMLRKLEGKVEERTWALRKALDEKELTQEQLIRSESLAAIGQLGAGVAHELNNPLSSAKSLIQSIIEDLIAGNGKTAPDNEIIEDLKFADRELGRAGTIVQSLLSLSRQTETRMENVNLNSVVRDALIIIRGQHKPPGLKIIEEYAPNLPDIKGNFANLGQVIMNLIKNALDAVSDSGNSIYISTQYDRRENLVLFKCKDKGPGIPESIRKDIFKPFFTTKEVGKGTGLGLYICHEIIEKHGGSLQLENSEEQGAEFIVCLPL